jgi:hypothetical protein
VNELAIKRGDWSGLPMPIDMLNLTIHPSFSFAKVFADVQDLKKEKRLDEIREENKDERQVQIVGEFYSHRRRALVAIYEYLDTPGKRHMLYLDYTVESNRKLSIVCNTALASPAWGIEQEVNALKLLSGMVNDHQFKCYFLTGTFMETSDRSGVSYIFRKLRPTIALKKKIDGSVRLLCSLCMHPIGYYEDSFAGSLCPTDDIIAHLSLMRGDEHAYWKRCTQHQPWRPESGL